MARPLRGSIKARGALFVAEIPAATGSTKRVRASFATEAHARAWLDQAISCLTSGTPLPLADEVVAPIAPLAAATPVLTPAMAPERVALDWHSERYQMLQRGDAERAASVRSILERHVLPALNQAIGAGCLNRNWYRTWLVNLANYKDCVGDEIRMNGGGTRRGPKVFDGYHPDYLADLRRTMDAVLHHGQQLNAWTLEFDPATVATPKRRKSAKPKPAAITTEECAAIASELHQVHQVVLWIIRILSLRLGEAYGIRVRDILSLDDGSGRGLVRLSSQGGRQFKTFQDGKTVSSTHKDSMKTELSTRVMPIPAQLMELFTTVVEVFHTDSATGVINADARLVPGLELTDAGGQDSFRAAIKLAASRVGVARIAASKFDEQILGLPRPKDMRSSVATELAWADLPDLLRKRWLGHAPGSDVHHKHYVLDDPGLTGLMQVAQFLEDEFAREVPLGLLVPTRKRCTTGKQLALAVNAFRIDAQLTERGWLVRGDESDQADPLLTVEEAAGLLGKSPVTVRRFIREGRLCGTLGAATGQAGSGHLVRSSVVMDFLAKKNGEVTLTDLADELLLPYNRMRNWIIRFELPTMSNGQRGFLLSEKTEKALRELACTEQRLKSVGVTFVEAAAEMSKDVRVVKARIANGELEQLLETGPDGARYVSRKSLDAVILNSRRVKKRRLAV